MAQIESYKPKPNAHIYSDKNIVKGKEVGDHITLTISGKVTAVSQDEHGFNVSIELNDSISKEQFEKMDSEDRKSHMEKSILNK